MGTAYTCSHAAALIKFLPPDSALLAAVQHDIDNRDPFAGMDERRLGLVAELLGVRR